MRFPGCASEKEAINSFGATAAIEHTGPEISAVLTAKIKAPGALKRPVVVAKMPMGDPPVPMMH